jgi:predicted Mrr-cat superfamily restriction endonuclease
LAGEDKKRVKREVAQRRMQVNRQKARYKGKFKYDEFAENRADKARMLNKRTYDFDEDKERDLMRSPDRFNAPWRRV